MSSCNIIWIVIVVAAMFLGWQLLNSGLSASATANANVNLPTNESPVEKYNSVGYRPFGNQMTGKTNLGETNDAMLGHTEGSYAQF